MEQIFTFRGLMRSITTKVGVGIGVRKWLRLVDTKRCTAKIGDPKQGKLNTIARIAWEMFTHGPVTMIGVKRIATPSTSMNNSYASSAAQRRGEVQVTAGLNVILYYVAGATLCIVGTAAAICQVRMTSGVPSADTSTMRVVKFDFVQWSDVDTFIR